MEKEKTKYPPLAINNIASLMALKDVEDPNYLRGTQLVNIFQELGFPDKYSFADGKGIQTLDYGDGLSRLAYTCKRLEELNKTMSIPYVFPIFLKHAKEPVEAVKSLQEIFSRLRLPLPVQLTNTQYNPNNSAQNKSEEKETQDTIITLTAGKEELKKETISIITSNEDSNISTPLDKDRTDEKEDRKKKLEIEILGDIPEGRPIVFISYSWDSKPHEEWVAKLAKDLTDAGIYVLFDQYLEDGTQLSLFMDLGINKADKVLIIGTEKYHEKSLYSDSGAAFEGCIIKQSLFSNLGTKKFITCLRSGSFNKSFPLILSGNKGHDFTKEENYKDELDKLCRNIWKKPKLTRPKLGDIPEYVK